MLNQPSLFTNTAQIPHTGLKTQKEQAIDPLEGLRRKEGAKEEYYKWLNFCYATDKIEGRIKEVQP